MPEPDESDSGLTPAPVEDSEPSSKLIDDSTLPMNAPPVSIATLRKSQLSDKQHAVLNFIEQEFLLHGAVPTGEMAERRRVCDKGFYVTCLRTKAFKQAMERRGITAPQESSPVGVLTEHQLIVANSLLDLTDNRSKKKKLAELKVPTQTYEAWLRDPAYQSYVRQRAENALNDNLHESHLALIDRVRSGDIAAIKYFNEITGRYVPNSHDKVDVNAILIRVLEVIQKHVQDPVALEGISNDMLAIAGSIAPTAGTANQVANAVPVRQGEQRSLNPAPAAVEGTVIAKRNLDI